MVRFAATGTRTLDPMTGGRGATFRYPLKRNAHWYGKPGGPPLKQGGYMHIAPETLQNEMVSCIRTGSKNEFRIHRMTYMPVHLRLRMTFMQLRHTKSQERFDDRNLNSLSGRSVRKKALDPSSHNWVKRDWLNQLLRLESH